MRRYDRGIYDASVNASAMSAYNEDVRARALHGGNNTVQLKQCTGLWRYHHRSFGTRFFAARRSPGRRKKYDSCPSSRKSYIEEDAALLLTTQGETENDADSIRLRRNSQNSRSSILPLSSGI